MNLKCVLKLHRYVYVYEYMHLQYFLKKNILDTNNIMTIQNCVRGCYMKCEV